jgi:hypothetical protein
MPISHIDPMYQIAEDVLDRNVGGFAGWPRANEVWDGHKYGIMHCCTGNGARAIYYAWEHILTHSSGKLRVNLMLNRASQWADIASHVPYVGQVDVKIKEHVDLSIRIPEWVDPAEVEAFVNNERRQVGWSGRYALVGAVMPGDTATLTFPISEQAETIWVEKKRYEVVRKGNDVVAIDPPGRITPLYQREQYRRNETRWRRAERFVSGECIYW